MRYRHHLLAKCLVVASMLVAVGCGDEEDRFEVVNKLRGVGLDIDPPIEGVSLTATTGSVRRITGYLLLPLQQSIDSVESYKDPQPGFSVALDATVTAGSVSATTIGALQLITFSATATIPITANAAVIAAEGPVRFRIGFRVRSGSEEELLVGDMIAVPPGNEALGWQPPTVDITSPAEGAALTAGQVVDLKASVTESVEETVKARWFVSSGEIKNFQGKETTWENMSSGTQTVVFAAHPRKTWKFSIRHRTVQVP